MLSLFLLERSPRLAILLGAMLINAGPFVQVAQAKAPSLASSEVRDIKGSSARRLILNDNLGVYHDLPASGELQFSVQGAGRLVLYIVNHRTMLTRESSVVAVSDNGKAWRRLKVPCSASTLAFRSGKVLPCRYVIHELETRAGSHAIGLRLSRNKLGASVHIRFVSEALLAAVPEAVKGLHALRADSGQSDASSQAPGLALVPSPAPKGADRMLTGENLKLKQKERSALDWNHPLLWAGIAVTGIAAGGALYFGLRSKSKFDEGARNTIQLQRDELNADGTTAAIVANSLFALAGAALTGTAAFLVYGQD